MAADLGDRPHRDITLICAELTPALELLQSHGLRLDVIFPADEPHSAILTSNGQRVRLTSRPDAPPPSDELPDFEPAFVLTHAGSTGGEGRAGMHYRDLIPSRLGGRYIASHIAVPDGPVADWVHYHQLAFQLIVVRRGWVRLVYEDQGEPFVMKAGDVILQPPQIRHRVLEAGDDLEVVEISCPALHPTFAEHEMALPNGFGETARRWSGQLFLHFLADDAEWSRFHGGEGVETNLDEASGGIANAHWLRPAGNEAIALPPSQGELVFGFVAEGRGLLERAHERHSIGPADSFVIPPDESWRLSGLSSDFRLLLVTSIRPETA